jgi:aspartyl-tRNA synthetase
MVMASEGVELLERSVGCGQVTEADAAVRREIVITGWVHRRRDLGRLIFVEVRDATGRVQVVFDPTESAAAHRTAEGLRLEDVVGVQGSVVPREAPNPDHPTGQLEVRGIRLIVHNRAERLPFPVDDEHEPNEETRLTYRYLDLRRARLQRSLRLRHRLASAARRILDEREFVEVETPVLTRSTPEGARDYLVPSRIHPGRFYALPQSPQLFKQLLMVAGFERYYQFARCFRDEDQRADRQPEFTQIDLEISFATPETVYRVVEAMIAACFREIGVEISVPFRRMAYAEALSRFGTDRPDLRFGMELRDAEGAAVGSGFTVFDGAVSAGGAVRGIAVPRGADASRRILDSWIARAREAGADGLVWIKVEESGRVTSPALKALGENGCRAVAEAVGASPGDVALLVAGRREVVNRVLDVLRLRIAGERGLIPPNRWELVWVEAFPLLQWDNEEQRWVACHHPFTAPRWEDLDRLETDPGSVRAQAYDLVLNGTEIGGGSIRIHGRPVQERVFRALGIRPEEARSKFGFLLDALQSGAPPHGGIALGFDRVCAMLNGSESIRDVIAFPKSARASCLMTGSPAEVDDRQLIELGIARTSSEKRAE